MSENNAGGAVENPNESGDKSFSRDELLQKTPEELADIAMNASAGAIRWKKKALEKEVTPEEKKEKTPETPKETTGLDAEGVQKLLATEKYLDANPELRDHRDKFVTLTSAGLSEEGAKAAILAENPEIVNRQKTNSMSITGDIVTPEKTTYTLEELIQVAGSNQKLYNQIMDRKNKGEITVI